MIQEFLLELLSSSPLFFFHKTSHLDDLGKKGKENSRYDITYPWDGEQSFLLLYRNTGSYSDNSKSHLKSSMKL